ncbi:MAG TPA: response regulator [Ignavibacteriales bacterium]|nr:response regulator [Ignavibacteriales bacterium]
MKNFFIFITQKKNIFYFTLINILFIILLTTYHYQNIYRNYNKYYTNLVSTEIYKLYYDFLFNGNNNVIPLKQNNIINNTLTPAEQIYFSLLLENKNRTYKFIAFNDNLYFIKYLNNVIYLKKVSKVQILKFLDLQSDDSNSSIPIVFVADNNVSVLFNVKVSPSLTSELLLLILLISSFLSFITLFLTYEISQNYQANLLHDITNLFSNIFPQQNQNYNSLNDVFIYIQNFIVNLQNKLYLLSNIDINSIYIYLNQNLQIVNYGKKTEEYFKSIFNINIKNQEAIIEYLYKFDNNLAYLDKSLLVQPLDFHLILNDKYLLFNFKPTENNLILLTIKDETLKITNEIKLNKHKEVLNKLFESTNNFFVLIDNKLRIYKYSNSLLRILERNKEEVDNKFLLEFVKSSYLNLFNNFINKISNNPNLLNEKILLQLKTKSNVSIDYELNYRNKLIINKNIYYLITGRNIVEKKQIESKFTILQSAIDSSTLPIIITDPNIVDNPIVYVNKAFEELTGYSKEEVINLNPRFLYREDKQQPNLELIKNSIQKALPCKTILRNYKKDGTFFWNEIQISPIFDNNGNLSNYIAYLHDITQDIILQEQLLEAKEKAEAGFKSRSEFLTIMSHEIKTPLNGILGILNILENSKLTNDQINLINIIKKNSTNLLNILNNILQYTNLISGKANIHTSKIKLQNLLTELFSSYISVASQKGIDFYVYFDPKITYSVKIDYEKFKDMLSHILSNALKFTDNGFVGFSIKELNRTDTFVTLSISIFDTGIGIDNNNLPNIFNPFYQVDSSNKRKYGGIGIGLAIVKEIANLFDATFWIDSKIGNGTTFHLTLKMEYEESSTENNTELINSLKKMSYLLIYDNPKLEEYYNETFADLFNVFHSIDYESFIDNPLPPFDVLDVDVSNSNLNKLTFKDVSAYKYKLLVLSKKFSNNTNLPTISKTYNVIYKPFTCKALFNVLYKNEDTAQQKSAEKTNQLKILIAEDNKLNQKVAGFIFSKLGYNVDFANDGFEAILKAKENTYDFIFMDLQMPEVDGFDATKQILKDKDIVKKPIIIAMTANTQEDDKLKCIEAGMVDFITKPITPDMVENVISKFLVSSPTSTDEKQQTKENTSKENISENYLYFDENQFKNTFNLETDKDFALEMLDLFTIQAEKSFQEIKKAFEEKDFEKIRSIAHQLKGSSGNLGASKFHDLCANIDKEIKQKIFDNIPDYINKLEYITIKTIEEISKYIQYLKNTK